MFTIRSRHADDLVACVPVLARVHARDGYPVNWPADPAAWLTPRATLAAWVADLSDPNRSADRIAGHALLCSAEGDQPARLLHERTGRPIERIAVLSRLFVDPGTQGRAIGAALVDTVRAYAHQHGWQVVLGVLAGQHARASAFYQRQGCDRLGVVDFTLSDGRVVPMHCYVEPDRLSAVSR